MTNPESDLLNVLACQIDKRPRGAASFMDLLPSVRGIRRETGALIVEFDPAALAQVEECVAAERQCCAEIGWDLATSPQPRLTITATPAQLDALAGLFH